MSVGAVLVTGGLGYVGSHAAKALAETGRPVVVIDDLSTGHREFAKWGTFVEGDAGNGALVRRVCREHRIKAVLHFAGKISVEESTRDPVGYRKSNVEVTARLAEVTRAESVRAFVFSSSAAVYGPPDVVPIPETHPLRPTSPYGESKVEAEALLVRSCATVASLRYFNAAGADPAAGIGEWHEPETHLIPLALRAARTGEPLTVYGRDWPTPDGTCVRDYVHVMDLADAHVVALARLERAQDGKAAPVSPRGPGGMATKTGGVWNLGTGQGHSVLEVIAAVERATGKKVAVIDGPRRAGDSPVLVADAAKARRELGFRTARSTLDRIVADAWAFLSRA